MLADTPTSTLDVILLASGSEVQLALSARDLLEADGIGARVLSMPCLEWFAEQSESYRESVLPGSVQARVSVEASLALSWRALVGDWGRSISLEHFGASADGDLLFREFGFTPEAVAQAARASVAEVRG